MSVHNTGTNFAQELWSDS